MKGRRLLRILIVMIIAIGMTGAAAMPASAAVKTPYKVTGVKATKATSAVISISWKASKNSKKYEVQYKLKTAKKWKTRTTKAKATTFKGLKQNTKYQFRVRGVNGKKKGKYSTVLNQQTYLLPAKVDNRSIYALERTKGSIKIKWTPAKNATYYEVTTCKLNSTSLDTQQSDYEEYSPNKYRALPEFSSRTAMRANTWYEFRVRAVNTKTGKFPALKSAWSGPFYACTTKGNRVITAVKDSRVMHCEMNDVFVVDADEVLVPEGIYLIPDPTDDYYVYDDMSVAGITFPEGFKTEDMITDEVLDGCTYNVGESFEGYTIEKIIVCQDVDENDGGVNGYQVTFKLEGEYYMPTFCW